MYPRSELPNNSVCYLLGEVADMVVDGFRATGRSAGVLPTRIGSFAKGHPQRSMQLADAGWRLVPEGSEATADTWADALDHVRAATANGHERLYSGLADGEKAVLRILAGGGSIFGTAAEVLELSNGAAQHDRQVLTDRGYLTKAADGRYSLVDPSLEDWLQHRFSL